MVLSAYLWSQELTLFSSISGPLQEKPEPTLFHTNPRQGKKNQRQPSYHVNFHRYDRRRRCS